MIRLFLISLIAAFSCLGVGCTRFEGGDRDLWGTWHLVKIEKTMVDDTAYDGNTFWKFQADVVLIQEVDDDMHERIDHFGTWSLDRNENTLTLYFNHSDDNSAEGTGVYVPPSSIGIGRLTVLNIKTLDKGKMILSHTGADDIGYVYFLERYF